MTRRVVYLIRSSLLLLALPMPAAADDWHFFDASPIFVDARDVVSWEAGRSIGAGGDVALQDIRENLRIVRPAMPAYEPGTA